MPDFSIAPCERTDCHCRAEKYNRHHQRVTCLTTTSEARFGLYDGPSEDALPAYILFHSENEWMAEVINIGKKQVTFKAIDNCVLFDEDKCEGMLLYEGRIIFVEFKYRDAHGWLAQGRRQLTNSIRAFAQSHHPDPATIKAAYVCNGERPGLIISDAYQNQIFKDETDDILCNGGIELSARQDIILE